METVLNEINSALIGSGASNLRLGVALLIGGFLAVFIRFLYHRCSSSMSNTESFSSIFPLLTLVTIGVISVVKSSLALSLGLVGALSIVRFRAAIKDPEELVYLFLCIGIGLALGAGQIPYAVIIVFFASLFILGRRYLSRGARGHNLMVTVSGEAGPYFDDPSSGALQAVKEIAGRFVIQRYEIEDGQGRMRLMVKKTSADETAALIGALRERLPGCHVSYVNMDVIV